MSPSTLSRRAVFATAARLLVVSALPFAAPSAGAQTPERLVTIGGAVTEIVAALGAADRIVAVDTTSTWPPEAVAGRPTVGYMRQLSAEGILSLAPTRVVAVEGAGPPGVLKLVADAGIPVDRVPDRPSPEGLAAKIRAIGRIVGRADRAESLAAEVTAGLADLARERAAAPRPVRALFVIAVQNGRPMAAGRGSAADAMLRLAGAVNVVDGFDGYKPLSDEAAVAAAPDVVVTMRRPGTSAAELFALPALAGTPAARAGALVEMDGLYLLGFGPRTPEAARDLRRALIAKVASR